MICLVFDELYVNYFKTTYHRSSLDCSQYNHSGKKLKKMIKERKNSDLQLKKFH